MTKINNIKMTIPFKGKTDLLKIICFLVIIASIFSCDKEHDLDEPTVPAFDVTKVSALVEDFAVIKSYFNEDSLSKFQLALEDGSNTNFTDIFSNLGIGIDSEIAYPKLPIFKNIPLDPIVKISLNEIFEKKVIVSWDIEKNNHIIDSITYRIFGKDSQVRRSTSKGRNNCIYIDFLFVNIFGNAEINPENPIINDYLLYKSSNYEGVASDEITLSPQQFNSFYGDKYTSSITLGSSFFCRFVIAGINCVGGEEADILFEAMDLVKKAYNEDANWDNLTEKSNYFKNSTAISITGSAIPRSSFIFSIGDVVNESSQIDNLYKQFDFGILANGYESFSNLYPKYEFIK